MNPQAEDTNTRRGDVRADVAHDVCAVLCRIGTIYIEGVVLCVEDQIGAGALQRLAELIDRDGPQAFAVAEGDFVAMLATDHDIYAFKSFTSQYQIYYQEADGAVANRLSSFFDPAHSDWNEDYFARHVQLVAGYQFMSRETPLRDVARLLPGELLHVGPSITRKQLVRRNYTYRLDPTQRREDVAPQILSVLRTSIRNRLAARPDAGVCVEISGGLDSSFIACLLGEQASGIRGVMFSQPHVPSHKISEQYAKEVAERYGIDLVVMPPEELPQRIDDHPSYSDEPSDFFWFGDWFSRAVAGVAKPGSQVFTGFGADQLFLRAPSFLPYLLKHREFNLFARALPRASDLLSRGRANIGWQSFLALLPASTLQRLNGAFGGRWNPFDVSDVNMQPWLSGAVPWLRCGRSPAGYARERFDRERELVGEGILCDDWGYFSAPRTVTQSHFAATKLTDASPFCDLPLLDFVYDEVSALLVHDFDGRYKELLREAQKGVVPEALRNRQNDTFAFNSFQLTYVNRARDYFGALLAAAPEGWIDRRAAAYALEQLAFGITTGSTRSVMALMGYLGWREAFIRHCAAPDSSKAGLILLQREAQ